MEFGPLTGFTGVEILLLNLWVSGWVAKKLAQKSHNGLHIGHTADLLRHLVEKPSYVQIYQCDTRSRMTKYPIFSIVNWYCSSWDLTVNEVIMCRTDGRRRLTLERVTG